MIKTKADLKQTLQIESTNYEISRFWYFLSLLGVSEKSIIWYFQKSLRKWEYHLNNNHKLRSKYYRFKTRKIGNKYGLSIPPNCFDCGLKIMHLGSILVNNESKIGKNCTIPINTAIVATGGLNKAPCIGDSCFFGVGSTIVGDIKLGNNVTVGAGAVVVKTFSENNITLAGVPAKIVSHKAILKNASTV